MKSESIKETVRVLYDSGHGKKAIARMVKINVKTVRAILAGKRDDVQERSDKITVDRDLLVKLHAECRGYVQRMHEKLTEEYQIPVGYSTLTRLVREYGIGETPKPRDEQHPDIPGDEMQHDTSVYSLRLGDKQVKLVCSALYYRYSKMRYVKFYRRFNRFRMKCFFHEACMFFGYTAKTCIIDNTHLAVLHGTGSQAVFASEMHAFAQRYGFCWKAHGIRKSNRKAGKERNFYSLETNFFPGRTFADLEDLNRQVFAWATDRFAHRPQARTRLIPVELFELEKPYLVKLPPSIEAPYQEHRRVVDSYGYVAFDGNYYWVPPPARGMLTVIEYADTLAVYHRHTQLVTYPIAPGDMKNARIVGEGVVKPHQAPRQHKARTEEEERRLRSMGGVCGLYLDYLRSSACTVKHKPKLIRDLYRLGQKMSREGFLAVMSRAYTYRVVSFPGIEQIAGQLIIGEQPAVRLPPPNAYEQRTSYQAGRLSSEPPLSRYRDKEEDTDGQ